MRTLCCPLCMQNPRPKKLNLYSLADWSSGTGATDAHSSGLSLYRAERRNNRTVVAVVNLSAAACNSHLSTRSVVREGLFAHPVDSALFFSGYNAYGQHASHTSAARTGAHETTSTSIKTRTSYCTGTLQCALLLLEALSV